MGHPHRSTDISVDICGYPETDNLVIPRAPIMSTLALLGMADENRVLYTNVV